MLLNHSQLGTNEGSPVGALKVGPPSLLRYMVIGFGKPFFIFSSLFCRKEYNQRSPTSEPPGLYPQIFHLDLSRDGPWRCKYTYNPLILHKAVVPPRTVGGQKSPTPCVQSTENTLHKQIRCMSVILSSHWDAIRKKCLKSFLRDVSENSAGKCWCCPICVRKQ